MTKRLARTDEQIVEVAKFVAEIALDIHLGNDQSTLIRQFGDALEAGRAVRLGRLGLVLNSVGGDLSASEPRLTYSFFTAWGKPLGLGSFIARAVHVETRSALDPVPRHGLTGVFATLAHDFYFTWYNDRGIEPPRSLQSYDVRGSAILTRRPSAPARPPQATPPLVGRSFGSGSRP